MTEQLPGRLARRYHYDGGLLHKFAVIRDGHPVADTSFTRDPDGRILTERGGDGTREYRYDRAGQLVYTVTHAAERPAAAGARSGPRRQDSEVHIGYDAAGNRTSLRRGGTETHYRYDEADQLLAAETGGRRAEYRYDPSGRLIEETDGPRRRAIRYDGLGRPVEVTLAAPDGGERIQAAFTGDGLPASLVLTDSDRRGEEHAASVQYRWSATDALPQILSQRAEPNLDDAEHDLPGRLSADFAYGYERTFASWADGAEAFHLDWSGSALRTEETAAWALADRYSPFGEPEGTEPAGRADRQAPELPRFGFQGELALRDMIFLRARSYDTSLGRFTTRDPASLSPMQPVNPYAYSASDPVNITDPSGACLLPVGCGELHHIASSAEQLGGGIIRAGEHLASPLILAGENLAGPLIRGAEHLGGAAIDTARHDAAYISGEVVREVATNPLLHAIVGTITRLARALLSPEIIRAALEVIARAAHIILESLEVIELALALMALAALILILGKVLAGDEGKNLPTLEVKEERMPGIANNIQTAQDEGKPSILHRTRIRKNIRRNRREALKNFHGPGSPDEYPFASTYEGGAGARVVGVPDLEQDRQGYDLMVFYGKYQIGEHGPYRVVVTGLEKP